MSETSVQTGCCALNTKLSGPLSVFTHVLELAPNKLQVFVNSRGETSDGCRDPSWELIGSFSASILAIPILERPAFA
jgi:hypothetical protein